MRPVVSHAEDENFRVQRLRLLLTSRDLNLEL